MQWAIHNHKGDVYDPFVGSGTTVIAGEQEGRIVYAIEIEPAYVDVTVTRWEDFTGRKAKRMTKTAWQVNELHFPGHRRASGSRISSRSRHGRKGKRSAWRSDVGTS